MSMYFLDAFGPAHGIAQPVTTELIDMLDANMARDVCMCSASGVMETRMTSTMGMSLMRKVTANTTHVTTATTHEAAVNAATAICEV